MSHGIAIVGVACRYPDARSPLELWENALARRRAFRRIPRERLPLPEYWSADRGAPDATYGTWAAVLEGYHFDRTAFRVSGETFEAADLAHWVALDVASEALADAGFESGSGAPRATTAVLVGNTLTGEFSRAATLRLRWPYVRRVVDSALDQAGDDAERRTALLQQIEASFKAPFAPVGGETLAGSLSNTIAGRICNHFDFNGGGYTVDGACASSLLAVAHACSSLIAHDADLALAGGVDLSLDPFELVGFAKAGALAADDMRVYDARPTGFWPGEGCGFAVLMREEDAAAQQRRVYAVIRGWGVSSDGRGGMTRPELHGQVLALERAYDRAAFGAHTVGYFEGHGTGTAVGDATELAALDAARRHPSEPAVQAAIGSIKANIGHTKAAAGIAGLLKATYAVHTGVRPPATGCGEPHEVLRGPDATLHAPEDPTPWPAGVPVRAGVSAMGFGGINVHVAIEGVREGTRPATIAAPAWQDAELVLLSGRDRQALRDRVDEMLAAADTMSFAELTDLAVHLQRAVPEGPARVAVVAASPSELDALLREAHDAIERGVRRVTKPGLSLSTDPAHTAPRIALLFTGQGAPVRTSGGLWSRRFGDVAAIYRMAALPRSPGASDTSVAQPSIVVASLAAARVLEGLGVRGDVAIGHSLGEISAIAWAGGLSDEDTIAFARARGELMTTLADGPGAMAAIAGTLATAESLIDGTGVVVAAINAPHQVVVSGERSAIDAVSARAAAAGVPVVLLPVSYAFHSPLMRRVGPALAERLARTPFHALHRTVVSTVTGRPLSGDDDLRGNIQRQLVEPVRFLDAVRSAGRVDLFLEVGPGRSLVSLAGECGGAPCLAVDAAGPSLRDLLSAVGAAFALGVDIDGSRLSDGRFSKPCDVRRPRRFLVNPCERASRPGHPSHGIPAGIAAGDAGPMVSPVEIAAGDACASLRALVSRRTALPLEAVADDSRFLSDLHLNSITVSELLREAATQMGLAPLVAPTDYADARLCDAARALDALKAAGSAAVGEDGVPAGVDSWIRVFVMNEREAPLVPPAATDRRGPWRVIASPCHPLRDGLMAAFRDERGGPGCVVCLDAGLDASVVPLLDAAKAELRERRTARLVVVQLEAGASGFARTLFLESGHLDVIVVTVDPALTRAADAVHAEACAAGGFVEVRLDASGRRFVPVAEPRPLDAPPGTLPLGRDDVLLVTGGGKGIGAEAALALARDTGVRLALVGRSAPESDAVLAANLARIRAHAPETLYVVADVGDAASVRAAIDRTRSALGEITAVLHAAGVNEPALIAGLDEAAVAATLRTKLDGARHLLAALDRSRLRLLVTFGSVIARTGLAGEAHYALANERLREWTVRVAAELTHCRTVAIEWSVWAAPGMGERLGRVDALARQGVTPIDVSRGVAILRQIIADPAAGPSVVVCGRTGRRPALPLPPRELPFVRFLESPQVHYPGIELVADAELSTATDPYLADHALDGHLLFPVVMGLEAMAQCAMALTAADTPPCFDDVELVRPIVIPRDGTVVLRIAALVETPDRVRVTLRTSATGFQTDHFRAVCRWNAGDVSVSVRRHAPAAEITGVDAQRDLYGSLLFQAGRFARLGAYRRLGAHECLADIDGRTAEWFGAYLPAALVLGDPGARDAALHGIQPCIPQRRLVPVAVDRIQIRRALEGPCRLSARQRSEDGDAFVWDLEILDSGGEPLEVWTGLRLRAIAALPVDTMRAPLVGPYVERRLAHLGHPAGPRVLVIEGDGRSHEALGRLLRSDVTTHRRPDGRPEASDGTAVSVAHAGPLTMAIAADMPVGCDLEPVRERPADLWRDLLGSDRSSLAAFIARGRNEALAAGATRVWAALESLKKAGAPPDTPLTLDRDLADGWVTLRAGGYAVSTWITDVADHGAIAMAVVTGAPHGRV